MNDGLPDPAVRTSFDTWLHWDGKSGRARHDGHEAPLVQPPIIATGKLLRWLYFAPQARHCRVRFSGGQERDMTERECEIAMLMLERLCAAAAASVTVPGDL